MKSTPLTRMYDHDFSAIPRLDEIIRAPLPNIHQAYADYRKSRMGTDLIDTMEGFEWWPSQKEEEQ